MVGQCDRRNQQKAAAALQLAQTVASRICHDLAGTIGGLGSALDVALEDRATRSEALDLAKESADLLRARLRLLRVAFGPAETAMGMDEFCRLLAGMPHPRRVRLRIATSASDAALAGGAAALLICLVMLGVECLAGEGDLVLERQDADSFVLQLLGPRAAWPAGFGSPAAAETMALSGLTGHGPRGILAPFSLHLSEAAGASLRLLLGSGDENAPPLLISFAQPARS